MKLTKLEHAALILEINGQKLFIDPGSLTTALTETTNAAAVVLTHEHPDHWTPAQLDRIRDMNPDVPIYGPQGVADAAPEHPISVVENGDTVTAGAFTLRFFGEKHAIIHESIPVIDNVGVLVNDELYYGGDSFTIPTDVQVGTLAVPAGAPWLKISEVIDYVLAVKPRRSFPTHEMGLSRFGKDLSNARIGAATEEVGGEFFALEPGDSLDI
ncbi:MBL fold metallo-hydrolase [Cryobacterium frigoriphilum]|uniref:MBL fold metallo-hydrolase n=1 Tax=Cryobacterium frigoriphilum TaxID=1259150 RepID=A0A4R9AB62_9MICO|nr:MBL fold metallo-hydrolase [Cryobacterium frigoriphilum]TFD55289.1 MBL fold metallo-hydrolase [Cryobacterium frigoriphilum]